MVTKKITVLIYTKIFVDPQNVYVQNIYVYEITLLAIPTIIYFLHNANIVTAQP